jgi:membrane fusion protein (multidrug efflux system)
MTKRMVIMLAAVGVLFGGIFGFQIFKTQMMKKFMASAPAPVVTVSATKAVFEQWQGQIKAVGSLRAARGVDVASEIAGMVRSVHFKSGDQVKAGQLLVQLNADSDIAQLRMLTATAELAQSVYDRDKLQFDAQAVSRATLDVDAADLKGKQAQVAQQTALVEKKTIRAPFAGRLGISSVSPGQYLNPGDMIVTLQALDALYVDFHLPQQELSRISTGQAIVAVTETHPDKEFKGTIVAINPKVDLQTRNVRIEATLANLRHELLPGMYVSIRVQAGAAARYLTLPRTAVTFNPYGETVYVIEEKGKDKDGKANRIVRQVFVTVGPARGDQVAILKGIKEGDILVTSGQLKLKNGSGVIVDNRVQPLNDASPIPTDK